MARDLYINGEAMVYVKGRSDSTIGTLQELGLSDNPITVQLNFVHSDCNVNAWGQLPIDKQWMLGGAVVSMTLVHYDPAILNACLMESMCAPGAIGTFGRAGQRLGNNQARFTAGATNGWRYVELNIASPVGGRPWRFFNTFLMQPPASFPLGVERSIVTVNWAVVPYTQDPWNAGAGAYGYQLWDHTLSS